METDYEPTSKPMPWGVIAAVMAIIGLIVFGVWLTGEKKNERAKEAAMTALDDELTRDQNAIKDQREKVMDLTRRVEILRSSIQSGEVKKGKAAVAEFNQLAAQQRTERDKFTKMAEEYNKKVAKYRELEQ